VPATTKRLEDEHTRSVALELYLTTNHVSSVNHNHTHQVGFITIHALPQQPPNHPQLLLSSRLLENPSHMVSNTLTWQQAVKANQRTQTPSNNNSLSGMFQITRVYGLAT